MRRNPERGETMAKIYQNVSELIGNTPLLELKGMEKKYHLKSRLLAKLEYLNPSGSVKDRAALGMIRDAMETGRLAPGATIVEPTSGNTGIGLAALAASMGFRLILTMPETMSVERRKILKAYGAEIVLTDGARGMAGAIEKAKELVDGIPEAFFPGSLKILPTPGRILRRQALSCGKIRMESWISSSRRWEAAAQLPAPDAI